MKGIFKLGHRKTEMIEFDNQTSMIDVYGDIINSFNDILPNPFHIEFYSCKARRILILDENLLNSNDNPFQSNSTDEHITNPADCEQFFIIDDSTQEDHMDSQSTTVTDQNVCNDLNDALAVVIPADELNDALLSNSNPSNKVIWHNNIANNDIDVDEDITDEDSTEENVMDSQTSNASSTDCPIATETTDVMESLPDRITFSSDVHPEQKHNYLTNKYNTDNGSDEHGGISLIQGLKTKDQMKRRIQVLPHILFPRLLCLMRQWILFIYAVYEEEKDETRIWFKHPHKGFLLPDQLEPNANFVNPIRLVLNDGPWKQNGDYTLKLYMLTERDKRVRNKEEIYRLDKGATIQIHKAEHIEVSSKKPIKPTRLLCVPEIDNQLHWPLFGLSGFIQPPTKKQKHISLTNSITVQNMMPIPNLIFSVITTERMMPPPSKRQKL